MKDLELTTRRTATSQEIQAELDLDAAPEAVWKALTEAEELVRWFPFEATATPGAGGKIAVSWEGEWASEMEILTWEPPSHLGVSWPWTAEEGKAGEPSSALVDYYVSPREGGGAKLRLVHSRFPVGDDWDDIFDATRRGWSYELLSLKHYLENHRGKERRVARVRRPMGERSEQEVWDRLRSPDGLALEGSLADGSRYRAALPGGPVLEGRVLVSIPPTDFGAVVDGVESSLFRVGVGHPTEGDQPRVVELWLVTWGELTSQVEAIEAAWNRALDRIL